MKNDFFSPHYAALFKHTGNPTLQSAEKLRHMQKKCIGRNDPNTFYATVDPRPAPKVVWSYNTQAHFSAKTFGYQTFFAAVHPFWLPLYVGMFEVSHRLFDPPPSGTSGRDFTLTANVPLKHKSNKYYWYSQVSLPGTFDDRGGIVEYLSEFHRLAEFDRMVPARQTLTFRGKRMVDYDELMKVKLGSLLDASLQELLSPAHYKLLLAYRVLLSQNDDTSREGVSKFLGLSLRALDRGNVRLLDQSSSAFPAAVLTSVVHFAEFLNDFSSDPLPLQTRGSL